MSQLLTRLAGQGKTPDWMDLRNILEDLKGLKSGGFRNFESFSSGASSVAADTDYAGVTAVAATLTLPQAGAAKEGHILIIHDESGSATVASPITVTPYSGDTIDGSAASKTITTGNGTMILISKGGTNWAWLNKPVPFSPVVASTATSGAIAATTDWQKCDASGGALIMTLPLANTVPAFKKIVVSDVGATTNGVAVTITGGDTMRGGNNGTSHLLAATYTHVEAVSDGVSVWFITNAGAGLATL